MYEFGFTGSVDPVTGGVDPNTGVNSGEGWRAIAPATAAGLQTIGATEANFQGAPTVLFTGPGAHGIQLGSVGNNYPAGSAGQFGPGNVFNPGTGNQVRGFEFSGTLTTGSTDFGIASNSNGFINAQLVVPEPSSLALCAIASGAMAGFSMLRRRFQRQGA